MKPDVFEVEVGKAEEPVEDPIVEAQAAEEPIVELPPEPAEDDLEILDGAERAMVSDLERLAAVYEESRSSLPDREACKEALAVARKSLTSEVAAPGTKRSRLHRLGLAVASAKAAYDAACERHSRLGREIHALRFRVGLSDSGPTE